MEGGGGELCVGRGVGDKLVREGRGGGIQGSQGEKKDKKKRTASSFVPASQ